jgi:ankyrin repeat protein
MEGASMNLSHTIYVIVICFFWLSQSALAQPETEEDKHCSQPVVELVGKHFKIADFAYPRDDMYPSTENGGIIVSGVCKHWPNDNAKIIAAFAFDAGVEYEKQLLVTLVDTTKSQIIAAYKSTIAEDAATEVSSYSLKLDTARYILSKSTRAFGLRTNTSKDRCTYDGGYGDELTLFVVDGERIRPVLDLTMSQWEYGRGNRCSGFSEVSRKEANLFISVEPTVSNGFADLLITAKGGDDKTPLRAKIYYDGTHYGLESWQKAFNQWWDAIVINVDPAILLSDAIAIGDIEQVRALIEKGTDVNASGDGVQTPLHEAVYRGKKNMVEFLIDKGADVNAKARLGDTPLHVAAEKGYGEIIELLLAKGADINALGYLELTPLHKAASERHKDTVVLLISKGADINANKGAGSTPLHYAAMGSNKEIIEMMITKGADIHARDPRGLTPLHRAVYCGQKEAVELLLAKGSDIDAQDENLLTPLHWAASGGCKEIAEFLVTKGADVNAKNSNEETPLQLAAKNKKDEVVKFLSAKVTPASTEPSAGLAENTVSCLSDAALCNGDKTKSPSTLISAPIASNSLILFETVSRGDKAALEELLAKGANINAKKYGRPLLYEAVILENKAMVSLLLAKGANASEAGSSGETPLHGASYKGNKDLVELLLAKKADINAQTYKGETPLFWAMTRRHNELAKLLVEKGADINIKEMKRLTPLHMAAGMGNKEMVELLLSKKADVHARDIEGSTPLHLAVNAKSKEIIDLLLAKGAEINAVNQIGTPLHIAAYRVAAFQDKLDMVEFLIDKGADVNVKNREGATVLQQTTNDGQEELVKVLKTHGAK